MSMPMNAYMTQKNPHNNNADLFHYKNGVKTLVAENLTAKQVHFMAKHASAGKNIEDLGRLLDEQLEDPVELCHFEVLESEAEEHCQELDVEYSSAFVTHVFSCYEATGDKASLSLLTEYFDISVGEHISASEAHDEMLVSQKRVGPFDMQPWEDLAEIYAANGFNVYLSEDMLEVYPKEIEVDKDKAGLNVCEEYEEGLSMSM